VAKSSPLVQLRTLGLVGAALVAAILVPAGIQAFNPQPEPPGDFVFRPFGITPDQTVRVNLLRLGGGAGEVGVNIMLVDGDGNVVDTQSMRLLANRTAFHDVDGTDLLRMHPEIFAGGPRAMRAALHVVIRFDDPPDWDRPVGMPGELVPAVEVLDTATGHAMLGFDNPLVLRGFNPQPEPPRSH